MRERCFVCPKIKLIPPISNEKELKSVNMLFKQLPSLIEELLITNHQDRQLLLIGKINILLYREEFCQEVIKALIKKPIIPKIIQLLNYKSDENVRIAALAIFINLAFGNINQVKILIDHNIISSLKLLLMRRENVSHESKCYALWCLANIAGHSPQIRKILHDKEKLLELIPRLIRKCKFDDVELIHGVCWVLTNCFREIFPKCPEVFINEITKIIPTLNFLYHVCPDNYIKKHICSSIHHLMHNMNSNKDLVIMFKVMTDNETILNLLHWCTNIDCINNCLGCSALAIINQILEKENDFKKELILKLINYKIMKKFKDILNQKEHKQCITYKIKTQKICKIISNIVINKNNDTDYKKIIDQMNTNHIFRNINIMLQRQNHYKIQQNAAGVILKIILNSDTLRNINCIDESLLIMGALFNLFEKRKSYNTFSNKFIMMMINGIQHTLYLGSQENHYKYTMVLLSKMDVLDNYYHATHNKYHPSLKIKYSEMMTTMKYQQNNEIYLKCNYINCTKRKYIPSNNHWRRQRIANDWYRCKRCKSTSYCSKKCQKKDWNRGNHKSSCFDYDGDYDKYKRC